MNAAFPRINVFLYIDVADKDWKQNKIHRIEVKTGTIVNTYEGHNDLIYAIDVSPDGKYLAAASPYDYNHKDGDGKVRIWDVESGKSLHEIQLKTKATNHRLTMAKAKQNVPARAMTAAAETHVSAGRSTRRRNVQSWKDLVFINPKTSAETDRITSKKWISKTTLSTAMETDSSSANIETATRKTSSPSKSAI